MATSVFYDYIDVKNEMRKKYQSKKKKKYIHSGTILYVARTSADLQYKNSRPCTLCIHFMVMFGIDKVCYTTGEEDEPYRLIKVSDLAKEFQYVSKGCRVNS